jgi:hypothetical protein
MIPGPKRVDEDEDPLRAVRCHIEGLNSTVKNKMMMMMSLHMRE